MTASPRIFLVGLSGSGKSTAGALAAQRLGWRFVDADRFIEERAGRPVERIFAEDGEAAFRTLEAEALRALAGENAVLVASGGGAMTDPRSRRAMASGIVIWLEVDPAEAAERLLANPATEARPLLAGNVHERLIQLADDRRRYYRRADATVAVGGRSPAEVADAIVEAWEHAAGAVLGPSRLEEP